MIEKMRERITIEKSEGARDKNGNHKLVWKEYHSCYAYVNNLSGKEYWAASEVNAQDEVNFVIRYCKKIRDWTVSISEFCSGERFTTFLLSIMCSIRIRR